MAAEKKSKALALPDSVVTLLADADKQRGFPPGTMLSLMSQEIGGQESKYLEDPSAYHYGVDAAGRRGPKNSKVTSTAFGPFGIVKSTAAKPGYGLSPLKGMSFEDQLNFAADYLAARSKSAGGLEAGLAGYGEGAKYAAQVVKRRDGGAAVMNSAVAPVNSPPVQVAQAVVDAPRNIVATPPVRGEPPEMGIDSSTGLPMPMPMPNEWVAFTKAMQDTTGAAEASKTQIPTNSSVFSELQIPDFLRITQEMPANLPINFTGFGSYGVKG